MGHTLTTRQKCRLAQEAAAATDPRALKALARRAGVPYHYLAQLARNTRLQAHSK